MICVRWLWTRWEVFSAYIDFDGFHEHEIDKLYKILFGRRAHEMNAIAYAKLKPQSSV
mgnify:FL=1